mmetsp:Transcript_38612/g.75438  ORF Transcript_38612/g.75438 Transcript_38612/m.75438 type:complete len:272 (+) Transcript_38612:26-841(+)|eukprot:CAMPEP_0173379672 /NCGR_PEP_ID=MMETSP1356-20130122/2518_1 /TAXON_ID=77927 ORGANISM="Hemiselmis virescens, Strain PCC157" /NCGR_SAMPLE_ID=MMETSP1356 /ASSEMBLY_ACC=CAM_ASM_000847 /LENGTH=271 /DNA_ID=CAMNT_0014333043 /DNA_START=22 /DNA_END=837 /DNA_ORIENTATION=+
MLSSSVKRGMEIPDDDFGRYDLPEQQTGRRKRHRAIEQKRRDRTKALLFKLQNLLAPSISTSGSQSKPSLSMNDILERVVVALTPSQEGTDDGGNTALARAIAAAEQINYRPPPQIRDTPYMLSLHALDVVGTYVYVNAACRRFGYEETDLIGQPAYSYFHPGDMKIISEAHSASLKFGVSWSVKYRFRQKDQSFVWVETSSRLTEKGISCVTFHVKEPADGLPVHTMHRDAATEEEDDDGSAMGDLPEPLAAKDHSVKTEDMAPGWDAPL